MVEFNQLDYKENLKNDEEEPMQENGKFSDVDDYSIDLDVLNKIKHQKFFLKDILNSLTKISTLWIISKGSKNGYEIMNEVNSLYKSFIIAEIIKKMGPSKIYPLLHQMEHKQIIKGYWDKHGKRKAKYYEITEKGELILENIRTFHLKSDNPKFKEFIYDILLKP